VAHHRGAQVIVALHEKLNQLLTESADLAKTIKWQTRAEISETEQPGSSTFGPIPRTVILAGKGNPVVREAVREALASTELLGPQDQTADISIHLVQGTVNEFLRRLFGPPLITITKQVARRIFLLRMFANDAASFYGGFARILAKLVSSPEKLQTEEARATLYRSLLWVGGNPPHATVLDIGEALRADLPAAILTLLQIPVLSASSSAVQIADAFRPGRDRRPGASVMPSARQTRTLTETLIGYFGPTTFEDFVRLCFSVTPSILHGAPTAPNVLEVWDAISENVEDVQYTVSYSVISTAAYLTGVYLLSPPGNGDYSAFGIHSSQSPYPVPNPTNVFMAIAHKTPVGLWEAICRSLGRTGIVDRITEEQWCELIRTAAIHGA